MVTVNLPRQLCVDQVLIALGRALNLDGPPREVYFNFRYIEFAKPSGIVLLHNLTKFLVRRGCTVYYAGTNRMTAPLLFLDDTGFFEDHLGRRLYADSELRATTCRLIEVQHSRSQDWISNTFIPWFSRCASRPQGALAELRTCMMEIFNNIQDHAGYDVGSIFAQWYPNLNTLEFAIGDFGRGIPANVATVRSNLSPAEAIVQAFEEGFSTKSNPNNRGAGLHFLRQNIAEHLGGKITVYSGGGAVICNLSTGARPLDIYLGESGYSGTLLDISLPTNLIEDVEPEVEELIW